MSFVSRNAMGDPISDIIGCHIGDLEVMTKRDLEIGCSLNPKQRIRDVVGFNMFTGLQAAMKDAATPGVLPWDVGRTKAQNQRLAEVFIRFNRGEQPSERGGKRVHNGGFSLAEVNAAVLREKAYRASLAPEQLAAREARFGSEKTAAHEHRMRNAGFNPIRAVSRTVKSVTNPLTRPIGRAVMKIPLAKEAASLVVSEANLFLTPTRFLTAIPQGLVTGGLKGAARSIKHEAEVTARESKHYVQNPIIRYGTKGAALVFPALTPVAAGVEAANQLVAAIEGKDPIKAALALTTIANTAAAATGGDLDAMRAIKTIKAVKDNLIPKNIDLGKVADMAKKTAIFTVPKGASSAKAAAAAHAILSIAKGAGSNSAAMAAQSVIKNTVTKAKAGDTAAKKGAAVLALVHKKQDPFRKSAPSGRGSFKKAARASKGKTYSGSYLVDSKGRVTKGNFVAK